MEKYIWHEEELPEGIKPRRVHAVLVTSDGRMFLRYKHGEVRKVTGGHIEEYDDSLGVALERELLEEINCKVDKYDCIGYIEYIDEEIGTHEYWARMVARLSEIGPARPDPDNKEGITYGRKLVALTYGRNLIARESAKDLEVPGAPGQAAMLAVVECALKTAEEKGYFTDSINLEETVINEEINPMN